MTQRRDPHAVLLKEAAGQVSENHKLELAGRERFLARVAQSSPTRSDSSSKRERKNLKWMMVAAACAIAASVGMMFWTTDSRLSYVLLSPRGTQAGGSVDASGMRFSDGSMLLLGEGTHVRLAYLEDRASIDLVDGAIAGELGANAERPWFARVGPFEVTSYAATARVSWSRETTMLTVSVSHGRLKVSGPKIGTRFLEAGQSLEVRAEDGVPSDVALADSTQAASTAFSDDQLLSPWPARFGGLQSSERDEPGVRETRGCGDQDIQQAPDAASLLALADHCRSQRLGAAIGAFQQVRERFAGTPEAALSAFELGRTRFTGNRRLARAHFEDYLREAPEGRLASEALGRLLELENEPLRRRSLAARYLRQFPNGAHRHLASEVLEVIPTTSPDIGAEEPQ